MSIEEWLQQFRPVHFIRTDQLGGEPWSPCDYKTICSCLVRLATEHSKTESWLDTDVPCTVSRRNKAERWGTHTFARQNRYVPLNHDFDAACGILKSINRYLSKQVRAICGHRKTALLPWRNADRPFRPVQPILTMSPDDCPCCAILDQWRAYAGKLIALRNHARAYGEPVYEVGLNDFRTPFSLEPRACAVALLSSFTWFASSLNRLLLQLSLNETQLWYAEEHKIVEFMRQRSALSLDVYRFNISPHGYVFSMHGEEVSLVYSLKHAFESLRACQALHHKGSLWPIDEIEAHTRFRTKRDDDWYITMSEYFQTRKNAPLLGRIPTQIPEIYG